MDKQKFHWTASIDGINCGVSYTTLKGLCKSIGINYTTTQRGRHKFVKDGKCYEVVKMEVEKIKK